jgi:hypothetical protein
VKSSYRVGVALLFLGLCGLRPALAAPASGERYRISLLTVSPGEELEERLGHSAIAVEDRQTGSELAYNFGTFGPTEHLVWSFLNRQLPFWVSSLNAGEVAMRYRSREIRVQELDLSPAQASRLAGLLGARVLPQNRRLDYDLFTANCVAPIRDVLDVALDGALRRHTDQPAATTFRDAILAGFAEAPLLAALSAVVFGPYTDAPRRRFELLFVPTTLHDALAELRQGEGPSAPPLVRSEKVWRGDLYSPPLPLPSPRLLAQGLGLLGLLGAGLLLFPRHRRRGRQLIGAVALLLCLASGLTGLSLYLLDFVPMASVQHNGNRFLMSPLELLAVPLLLLLVVGRLAPRPTRWLLFLLGASTLVALGHALVGHALGARMGAPLGPLLGCAQAHAGLLGWALLGRLALLGGVALLLAVPAGSGQPATAKAKG